MFEDQDQAQNELELILRRSPAAETEVTAGGGRRLVVVFGREQIRQYTEETWWQLGLRLAYHRQSGWVVGTVQGMDPSPDDLSNLLERAREGANASGVDSGYVPLPHPGQFESVLPDVSLAFDSRTARSGPAFCADVVAGAILPIHRLGYECGGHLAITVGSIDDEGNPGLVAIANSNELFQHHCPTRVHFRARVRARRGGIGLAEQVVHNIANLDVPSLIEGAIRRAEVRRDSPSALSSDDPVLLEPSAVASILALMAPHFTWAAQSDGRSFLAGQLGEALFDPWVTIRVNPAHPLLLERPFDAEGWPRRDVTLIREGLFENVLCSRAEAVRERIAASGYFPPGGAPGEVRPEHLVMTGDQGTVQDLVALMERGLVISKFSDLRWLDENAWVAAARSDLGVARVEGGRIATVLPDARFIVRLADLLARPVKMGEAIRWGDMVAPPIVTDAVSVVDP